MKEQIFQNMIFAGGPPRAGTTLLARMLNAHPEICIFIDNTVYECWRLYYYRNRTGLIQLLRSNEISSSESKRYLADYIINNCYVNGLAPSEEIESMPLANRPTRPDGELSLEPRPNNIMAQLKTIFKGKRKRRKAMKKQGSSSTLIKQRRKVPLEYFIHNYRLCLKSPEIVFVLPQLASHFPDAKFVITYRPIIEIAESMYRKGFEWELPSYHRRWKFETDENCEAVTPPGVPKEWISLWKSATDFERCVIYATSYIKAIIENVSNLQKERVFVYNYKTLCHRPSQITSKLSIFLKLNCNIHENFFRNIKSERSNISDQLNYEYEHFLLSFDAEKWYNMLNCLSYDFIN